MKEYALIASTYDGNEILITGTLQEILAEVETYATGEINHSSHGPLDQLTSEIIEEFATKLLDAQHLEIAPKQAVHLPQQAREIFFHFLSGQLIPPVQTRLLEADHPEIIKALPFIGVYTAYISQSSLNALTKASLTMWQRVISGRYEEVTPDNMPQWVSEFTALSTEEIHRLVDYPKNGQAAFRKFERLIKTTSGKDKNNLKYLVDVLKCSYSEDNSIQVATTVALLRHILTPTHGRYWSGSDAVETGYICERIFWESFGLIVAQRFSEGNSMSPGVADATEAKRRAGYEYLARVLVRFALFSKAQVQDALAVNKRWLDLTLSSSK